MVERKTLKQTVMTQVYGVTQYGARAQIKGMYCCACVGVRVCVCACVCVRVCVHACVRVCQLWSLILQCGIEIIESYT